MEIGLVEGYRNARWALYDRLLRLTQEHPTATRAAGALLMATLTALAAQAELHTPLTPVPFTLQVAVVLATGALLGRKWAPLSQSLYVGAGALGVPVFAGGVGGFSVLSQAVTAGYLFGFIGAAFLIGWHADARTLRPHRRLLAVSAMGIAVLITFAALDAYLLSASSPFATPGWALLLSGELTAIGLLAFVILRFPRQAERIEVVAAMILGLLVIYGTGALWFFLAVGGEDVLGTLELTVVPFIPWDLLKVLLVAGAVTALRPTRREIAYRTAMEAVRV